MTRERVPYSVWTPECIGRLRGDAAAGVMLIYIYANPQRNRRKSYPLHVEQAAIHLHITPRRARAALTKLHAVGLVDWNKVEGVVTILWETP